MPNNRFIPATRLGVNDGLKTNETCRFENHVFRNLSTRSSRPALVGVKANPDQACSALNARGIHSKKEETLALNPEENAPKNTAKPWFLNRRLSTGFGTMLRIGLRRLDHPIKMIRHEDIGVNLPARLGANLAQRLNEALAIRIIHKDQLAPVSAIHDVINRTSILDSQLAGRPATVLLLVYISTSRTDPFFMTRFPTQRNLGAIRKSARRSLCQ